MSDQTDEGLTAVRSPATFSVRLASLVRREHAQGRRAGPAHWLQLSRFSGVYLWIATIVFFALTVPETFLTGTTAKGILGDQAITAIVSLGVLVALNAGMFDLSIGQNLGFSAILVGWLTVKAGVNPALAVVITVGVGALIGAANAVLVVRVGIDSFIATLGTSSILLALTQIVSGQQFIGPVPTGLQSFTNWQLLGVSAYIFYALVLALICWVALEHTAAGRRSAATGANREAARLVGIATARHQVITLVVCACLASIGGVVVAGKTGSVSPTVGPEYILPCFAACFLSATQFKPGRFNVWGMVLALLLLGTGSAGLRLLGGQGWVANMFTGVALIVAVGFAVVSQRRRVGARV